MIVQHKKQLQEIINEHINSEMVLIPTLCDRNMHPIENELSLLYIKWLSSGKENIVVLNVNCGNIIIKLYPKISPKSVQRFKMLIESGKYKDIAFHRVIKNVLVQSGDLEFGKKDNYNYLYIGSGKSGYGTIKSELNDQTDFKIGTVGMARTNKLNTEDSQFFILLEDAPLFKGEYTPIGQVVYGLEILDTITDDHRREYVLRPDFINSFKLLID